MGGDNYGAMSGTFDHRELEYQDCKRDPCKFNPVTKPAHYNRGKYECIPVMQELGLDKDHFVGSAFKYIWRAGHKDDTLTDLEKAVDYLNRRIRILREEKDKQEKQEQASKPLTLDEINKFTAECLQKQPQPTWVCDPTATASWYANVVDSMLNLKAGKAQQMAYDESMKRQERMDRNYEALRSKHIPCPSVYCRDHFDPEEHF